MSEEERDEEWRENWEAYLERLKHIDKIPNDDWTDEDWKIYGEFLFRSYNKAHARHSYPEEDNED